MEEKEVIVFDIDNTIFIYDDEEDTNQYNDLIHPVFLKILEQLHDKIDIFYYTNGKTWGELKSELTKINPRYVHNFDDRVFHLDNDIRKNNDKTKSQTELILCLNNYYNPNQYEFKILMFDDCGIQTNLSQEQRKNEAKKSPTFKNLFPNNAKFITYVVQYYRLTNAV